MLRKANVKHSPIKEPKNFPNKRKGLTESLAVMQMVPHLLLMLWQIIECRGQWDAGSGGQWEFGQLFLHVWGD